MSKSVFIPQEVIRQKREGGVVSSENLQQFVAGITDGSVTDAQISAFAMAVYFQNMEPEEGASLTLAMRDSGDVIDWSTYGFDKDAPITDKHSTGGVGDKVSLMLAPIVAACGGFVPMVSGRGLGHTGGTLDKFEAIEGYDPYPNIDQFAANVKEIGCSIIGQTSRIAPADKRFYGIRDVTATVESVPLITASILSKKLSAGLGSLVMDVKFGNGAFMDSFGKARVLAENIVRVAKAAGTPTTVLLTDMNQVLGSTAGNAVEVLEAVEFLTNSSSSDERLFQITLDLAAHMVLLSGLQPTYEAAREKADHALASGRAAEVFGRMVAAQGGPADFMEKHESYLTLSTNVQPVLAEKAGYVSSMDTRAVGMAVVALGGGRTEPAQIVDHSVGYTGICQICDKIEVGQPLAMVYAASDDAASAAAASFKAAVNISENKPAAANAIAEVIEG
ncbi:MAG: thymidine phosphorylase [Kordiimonadales bacterium]|nr:MAG: thymidine phosphorylase [Kordiimonadales bacterium]